MAEVALENISKSFDQTTVLQDLSLKIQDREFVVLVGPSGCGKSTVLRIIAGLETPSTGSVYINSSRVNDTPPKDRDIAMVFQNYALYPHMSVFDNMAFGLKMRKLPTAQIREKVAAAAKTLDIEHLLARKPKQLSGGQRQRVALGRAIVRNPKVFLMDEPLSNLDAKLRVQMRSEIAQLHQRLQATTLYVTHDQTEAMTMGSRIVVLNQGVIQQVDSPIRVYSHPNNVFVAGFMGQMNFLRGILAAADQTLKLEDGTALALPFRMVDEARSLDRKPVILGIRPEHFGPGGQHAASPQVSVPVHHVEVLGSHQLLHFTLAGQPMLAKLPPDFEAPPGSDAVKLEVNLTQASLFDAETEARVG